MTIQFLGGKSFGNIWIASKLGGRIIHFYVCVVGMSMVVLLVKYSWRVWKKCVTGNRTSAPGSFPFWVIVLPGGIQTKDQETEEFGVWRTLIF